MNFLKLIHKHHGYFYYKMTSVILSMSARVKNALQFAMQHLCYFVCCVVQKTHTETSCELK